MATTLKKPAKKKASPIKKKAALRVHEIARKLREGVPSKEWDSLPRDLGKYSDHYLYGTPKE